MPYDLLNCVNNCWHHCYNCHYHPDHDRVYATRSSFLLDDDILVTKSFYIFSVPFLPLFTLFYWQVTSDADVFPLHPRVLHPLHRNYIMKGQHNAYIMLWI